MRETYKKTPRGFALIAAMIISTLLILLGGYLLSFSLSEKNISESQSQATKTYYLAETGVNEMINKIKNDQATREAFLNGTLSDANFNINRDNIFGDNKAAYKVSIKSTDPAYAEIIATSTYQMAGATSRRVIKASISKATNVPVSWSNGLVVSGGDLIFSGNNGKFTQNGGQTHSNKQIKINGNNTEVTINNGVISAGELIGLTGNNTEFNTPAPSYSSFPTSTNIALPLIDFNSDNLSSWKNRATQTYTYAEFKNLFGNNANKTLSGIIYVSGGSGTNAISGNNVVLTIKGVLVVDGTLNLSGNNTVLTVIADPDHPENGSGILANGNLIFGGNNPKINITGLLYSSANFQTSGNNPNFNITGGIVCNSAFFGHNNSTVTLNFNESALLPPLAPALNTESPIIKINHWEEQY